VGHDEEMAEAKFIKKVTGFGGKVRGKYVKSYIGVECECAEGHIISVQPDRLNCAKSLCGICFHQGFEKEFRKKIAELGCKVVGPFTSCMDRVNCECPKGHACSPRPYNLARGGGMCPTCRESKGEAILKCLLEKLEVKASSQFSLPNPPAEWGSNLRPFDFGNMQDVHEFDGCQHFKIVEYFGGKETFEKQRERDIAKTKAALQAGIKVIRYHYSFLELPEDDQLDFIKQARASTSKLIVYNISEYNWLSEFNPTSE